MTLFVGVATLAWWGIGPHTCETRTSPCYGLLGKTFVDWFGVQSFISIWLPALCILIIAGGAFQHSRERVSPLTRVRWYALGLLAIIVMLHVVTVLIGFYMLPTLTLAALTVLLMEMRDRSKHRAD